MRCPPHNDAEVVDSQVFFKTGACKDIIKSKGIPGYSLFATFILQTMGIPSELLFIDLPVKA